MFQGGHKIVTLLDQQICDDKEKSPFPSGKSIILELVTVNHVRGWHRTQGCKKLI